MSKDTRSTRRSFLKNGALLAVPLAAAGGPVAVLADDGLKARLAKLEDEATIRKLHQGWLRQINGEDNSGAAGAATPLLASSDSAVLEQRVRSVAADHSGQLDAIEIAPDGKSAVGRFQCAVEVETPIAQDCTLARMAHAQGSGFVRRTERRMLNVRYVKTGGAWSIAKAEFAPA
ncbi:MAG: hypothetical protein ACRD4R_07515 [Candidatus Acidiferrales bacterium]